MSTTDSCLTEEVDYVATADGQTLALTRALAHDLPACPAGPAFLLVHGFAQNRRAYTLGPMPRCLLERGARVFLGELRGHGDSRVPVYHSWDMKDHLDRDLPALIDGVLERTGVEKVHLIGHSMGGLLGCALLTREAPLASLTAAATPLMLGAGRPIVRAASRVALPLAAIAPRPDRVPMDLFLRAFSRPLSVMEPAAGLGALQKLTRLANPRAAVPEALREILANADRESPRVMEELAKIAVRRRPRLAGIDLAAAVREADLPLAAIVGSEDIFAPRAAIAPLEADGQRRERMIVEVEGGTHVDAIMGHHVPDTVERIWDFLMAG